MSGGKVNWPQILVVQIKQALIWHTLPHTFHVGDFILRKLLCAHKALTVVLFVTIKTRKQMPTNEETNSLIILLNFFKNTIASTLCREQP